MHVHSQVVEVSARYDDVCLGSAFSEATNAERDTALLQVSLRIHSASARAAAAATALVEHADRANLISFVQLGGGGLPCSVVLQPSSKMKAPVFLYYELDNFYQNHRRYMTE